MTVKYIKRRTKGLPDKPVKRIPKELRPPKVKKKQTGHNDKDLIEERDGALWLRGRQICGAGTRKRGKCDRCGFVPDSDENDKYTPHKGVCEKCGGKMRCLNYMLSTNGTCRLHGGNVPSGPASTHWKGGVSYHKYLPLGMAERFKSLMGDPDKLSTEEDIVILKTFILDSMDKMVGERALKGIRDAYNELRVSVKSNKSNAEKRTHKALKDMRKWLNQCTIDMDLKKEIKDLIEDKSRIASREAKRQVDLQMHMTAEQGSALLSIFAQNVVNRLDSLPSRFTDMVQKKLDGKPLTIANAMEIIKDVRDVVKRDVGQDLMKHMDHPTKGSVDKASTSKTKRLSIVEGDGDASSEEEE